MSFMDSAERVLNKANACGKVAVLIVAGKIKTISGQANEFDDTVRRAGTRLLGVYDHDCQFAWIEDDLAWAENVMK